MNFTTFLSYLIVLVLGPISVMAQVSDDFSDGDFSNAPVWSGDVSDFEVDAAFELHLNAPPVESESHLSTPSVAIENAQWDISTRMEFNPSSGNRAFVYLTSDAQDLEGSLNGYYVMLGNTADEVSLYRQDGTSSTLIIDGADDLLDTSPVTCSIRVTRDDLGNWELLSDFGNSGVYTSEGTVMDDTHSTSSFFGLRCDYSSTRSDLFFFDDIMVTGSGVVDTTAPSITNVAVVDDVTLAVTFSEPVDAATAESIGNYTWLPFNNPTTAALSGQTVTLTFGSSFPENTTETLQVESVEDLSANAIGTVTEEFSYFVVVTAGVGDVVINEIMADPTPIVGLPEAEFVELFNTSTEAFDLAGWNLLNSTTDEILDTYVLAPGGFVIICSDEDATALSAFGAVLPVDGLTALSNAGDDLYLLRDDGVEIDAVTYDDAWYGGSPFDDGGYTLERKNPFLACQDPSNWSASTSSTGGTPGQVNSIFQDGDTVAPEVLGIQVISSTEILIQFNESMNDLSLILGSYILTPAATLTPQSPDVLSELILDVSPPLTPGQSYSMNISNVNDCSGNTIVALDIPFLVPQEPEAGDIILTEIMADPSPSIGLPEEEYLELHNRSDKIIDLADWVLRNSSTDHNLASQIIGPGEYVILCDVDVLALFESFGSAQGIDGFTSLGNTGDDLTLLLPNGTVSDAVSYTDDWYVDEDRDEGGYSLELINPELPCSGSVNWRASAAQAGGTPGAINAVYDISPDVTLPQLVSASPLSPQLIDIYFSEPIEVGSVILSDVAFEPTASILGLNVVGNRISISLDEPLEAGVLYTITVSDVSDCSGNPIGQFNSVVTATPVAAQAGDLIINEILFNPKTGGVDFVELYNTSSRAISLEGWNIANRELGALTDVSEVSGSALVILPQHFICLSEDNGNISSNYPLSNRSALFEVDDLPSFPDDEGYVVLMQPNAVIHDELYYNEDYHFALIDDQNGVSLERVDYNRLTNDPTNWHSAASSVGYATPGYENSQLQPANLSASTFSLEPDVFTPDGDGDQDLLNLNYSLDNPGYLANIRIYDRDGRLIKRLTRNELLATQGTITWDGVREDGGKARIGVYIYLIELFTPAGDVSSTKLSCVLGGKL